MNIGKYVKDLLQENDTVIVPGLGAFISVYKPAFTDETTGILYPPSKEVSFNPDIKTNGGLLAGRIANDEHISHRKAVGKVEKICDDILYRLDKGERVTLEDTGTLYYDNTGILQFEPAPSLNFLSDAFGLEPVSLNNEKDDLLFKNEESLNREELNTSPNEVKDTTAETGESRSAAPLQQDEISEFYGKKEDEEELRGSGLHRFIFWSLILIIPAILVVLGVYLFRKKRLNTSYPVEIIVDTTVPSTKSSDYQQAAIPVDTAGTDIALSHPDTALAPEITDTAMTSGQIVPEKSKILSHRRQF